LALVATSPTDRQLAYQPRCKSAKDNAIANAAGQVGDAAEKAGNAAQDAANNTKK
jgi:hypothetical protein